MILVNRGKRFEVDLGKDIESITVWKKHRISHNIHYNNYMNSVSVKENEEKVSHLKGEKYEDDT